MIGQQQDHQPLQLVELEQFSLQIQHLLTETQQISFGITQTKD